jgi:hypothetical protein
MNYMDFYGLNEDEEKLKAEKKAADELTASMKELGDTAEETKEKMSSLEEDEAPMHIERLANAAEAAYDAGMSIKEICDFIEQHLGLKMGD